MEVEIKLSEVKAELVRVRLEHDHGLSDLLRLRDRLRIIKNKTTEQGAKFDESKEVRWPSTFKLGWDHSVFFLPDIVFLSTMCRKGEPSWNN